jgi:hypothetical protein
VMEANIASGLEFSKRTEIPPRPPYNWPLS